MESQKTHNKNAVVSGLRLHLAVDSNTHEIVCADLSLNNVTDSEAFRAYPADSQKVSGQPRQTGLDTRLCHDELRRKNQRAYSSRKERVTGPVSTQTQPCRC